MQNLCRANEVGSIVAEYFFGPSLSCNEPPQSINERVGQRMSYLNVYSTHCEEREHIPVALTMLRPCFTEIGPK